VNSVDSNDDRSPPDEPQFRDFVTRLLNVPKSEIDERERQRQAQLKTHKRTKPDTLQRGEVTREG
jgi:hypothetical protein